MPSVLNFRFLTLAVSLVLFTTGASRAQTVQIRLDVANQSGDSISELGIGSEFLLRGYTQDLRTVPQGVFAAYLDVTFDEQYVVPAGDISYGSAYPNGQSGTIIPGQLDEIGAFDGLELPNSVELMLFEVPMRTMSAGRADFEANPADLTLQHEVLLFGQDPPVDMADVRFVNDALNIVPEPSSLLLVFLGGFALLLRARNRIE